MNFTQTFSKVATTAKVFWRSHGATVLTIGGTVATVAGTVMACKSTLKVDEVLKKHERNIERIEGVHNGTIVLPEGETYTEKDYRKDILVAKTSAAKDLVKLYWPAGVTMIGGIAAILGGHGMIKQQNAALAAAYMSVDRAFSEYRNKVKLSIGEKDENDIYRPKIEITVPEKVDSETGEIEPEKKIEVQDPNRYSIYARWFDESSPEWVNDAETNLRKLKQIQNFMNDKLHADGYLFLNDVYTELGIPKCREGNYVGWRITKDGSTDNFVDFGLFNKADGSVRDFVNGYENCIILDFNVDGVILDILPKGGRGSQSPRFPKKH